MGCDSIITLDITITNINTAVIQNGAVMVAQHNSGAYQWLDCDNAMQPVSGAATKTVQFVKNGRFAVEITDNNCKDTSACYTVSGLSVNQVFNMADIHAYPNPFTQGFTLFTAMPTGETVIRITDMAGRVVYLNTVNEFNGMYIGFNGAPGTYFLEVVLKDSVKRMMLQKY